jgi:hypothetical protein
MPRNRLPRLIKKRHPKRQKGPRKTTEETSGRVRPERVNQWLISLIATWWSITIEKCSTVCLPDSLTTFYSRIHYHLQLLNVIFNFRILSHAHRKGYQLEPSLRLLPGVACWGPCCGLCYCSVLWSRPKLTNCDGRLLCLDLGYGHTSSISCWISASKEAQEIRAVGLNVRGHTEQ